MLETASPAESLLDEVRALDNSMPSPSEVRDYVRRFPELVPVIQKGCELSASELAEGACLSLELYVVPEIDDRYLSLYIRQTSYDPYIIARTS